MIDPVKQKLAAQLGACMGLLAHIEQDYRGLAEACQTNGLTCTAKDAIESADYIAKFLKGLE